MNQASTGTLTVSPSAIAFGTVPLGQTTSTPASILNGSSAPVQITQLSLTGRSFSVVGSSDIPVTIAAHGTYSLSLQFNPTVAGATTGQLSVTSNASTGSSAVISLSGTGAAPGTTTLSSISCSSSALIGSALDTCTVTLNAAAGSGGVVVSLVSSNSMVTVPSTVTVPVGATSAEFTATASSVSTAQTVTLTATASGASETLSLQLGAAVSALSVDATDVAFGSVLVNTAAPPQSVALTSTGTTPVTISGATVTGTGFTVSGIASSMTLNPGQAATLNVDFNPTSVGSFTGQLIIASNSSTSSSAVVNLSGSGTAAPAALSELSCGSGAITGSGSDACTVTLTSSAPSGGLTVNLSSSSSAVTLPISVPIPAGATSAEFIAMVSPVATAQVVTMTASAGGMFKSFALQLNAAILALSINATSVAFGEVEVNTPATQPVTLTSSGTVPVTINGATVTGTGYTLVGGVLPATLSPGQAATLNVGFDPTAVGATIGQLSITSNSSTNGTSVIGLSGTGTAAPVVAVAVAPASGSTTVGATQQFAVTVTGTSNTAVTWTVSGTGCSGATCGTISSTGLYTAPAAVPSPSALTITATSVSDTTKSASASVIVLPAPGATYYLAPSSAGGNDSNSGLSPASPWLTPNHALNCGDAIIAAPSVTYDQTSFEYGKWGNVTCSPGAAANVAWLKCATFDACKVNATNQNGIWVTSSYWGVQGWEVQALGGQAICFAAYPPTNSANIHHIIFANDIANGCYGSGFQPVNNGSAGVDYFVLIGNIAYNAAQQSTECGSGISITAPAQMDALPGTHIYVAGNFAWNNFDPPSCAGGTPTDGEGIIFDTFDANSYAQRAVMENNIAFLNGSSGFRVDATTKAPVFLVNNTAYGNNGDHNMNSTECGEITLQESTGIQVESNIAMTNALSGCGANPDYAFYVANGDSTDTIGLNLGYSLSGQNAGSGGSPTFSYGTDNVFGVNPNFANVPASNPGPPACAASTSVSNCVAPIIGAFVPQASVAGGMGYQTPNASPTYDPLFPSWLCNVNLPIGLISNHCS